jgi:threonine dehydratase
MVTQDEITAAAARIGPYLRRTPVLTLALPGIPGPVTLKLELLQASGSFKPRGAFNRLLAVPALPEAGVIAASGGNHGAAVAYAARALGVPAEIFVPELTGPAKRARIEGYGARLVVGGATYDEARTASEARAEKTGALVVHAYDQPEVVAGQGTVGLELAEQAPELTHLLVASGGGGLVGGIAAWVAGRGGPQIIAVEPEGCPCLAHALEAGHPVAAPVGGLAADSLGARQVGAIGFAACQAAKVQSVLVPDGAIRAAQRLIWDELRLVAEPGGATALAALIAKAFVPPKNAKVGVLLCGANADLKTFI